MCLSDVHGTVVPVAGGTFKTKIGTFLMHPKPYATQRYGQGPAGALTIWFEDQIKVGPAHVMSHTRDFLNSRF